MAAGAVGPIFPQLARTYSASHEVPRISIHMFHCQTPSLVSQAVQLLELVRLSTIEAVEAIGRWQQEQAGPPAPFMWNGTNYLLKVRAAGRSE